MGMFDSFSNKDGNLTVQLKVGPCLLNTYTEGDEVEPGNGLEDGVYHAPEGVVVIRGGRVESVTATDPGTAWNLPQFTKWGDPFNPETEALDSHNPIVQAINVLRATRKQ